MDGTRRILFVFFAVILVTLACSLGGGEEDESLPVVELISPTESDAVVVGQPVNVVASISASSGVARVELLVNGQEISTVAPPSSPATYNSNFEWVPVSEGAVVLAVIGYDQDGNAAEPAMVTVQVVAAQANASDPTITQPAAEETIMCTPPPCGANEAYYCPGSCPGGCGITCATFTPTLPPPNTPTFTPHPPTLTFTSSPTNTSQFQLASLQIVVSLQVLILADVEKASTQISMGSGAIDSATATCPAGSVVVSGGYASSSDMLVYTQFAEGNGWRVYAKNNAGSSKLLNAYAVCLKNTAGSITQHASTTSVPSGSTGQAEVSCPAGKIVTGGGFASTSNGDLIVYNTSKTSNGWQVYARNNGGSSKSLNVYAVCLSGVTATTSQVYEQGSVSAGGTQGVEAECPEGDLIVGGGFAAQNDFRMYNSSPKSPIDRNWISYAKNNSGSNGIFNTYAVCLSFD
jgi:hypothetical protein